MQNKANFFKDKTNATFFATKDFENEPRRRLQENKPNFKTEFRSLPAISVAGQMTDDRNRQQKTEFSPLSADEQKKTVRATYSLTG